MTDDHVPGRLPRDRLRDLGQFLTDLALRVRDVVADAVGDTLAGLAKDATRRLLRRPGDPEPVRPHQTYPYRDPDRRHDADDEHDPWDEDDEDDAPGHAARGSEPDRSENNRPAPEQPSWWWGQHARGLAAAGLWAIGWWLRRRGSPLLAVAAGLLASVAAALGPDPTRAAADLLNLHDALTAGGRRLTEL